MSTTLKERAYAFIRDQLLVGAIPVGDRVSDADIARQLGISRTPVREALVQLETQGLIEQQPGLGPRVKALDRRGLEESFELRGMLEGSAAALAAERVTDAELAALEDLCGQYEAVVGRLRDAGAAGVRDPLSDQLNILDMAFHLKVIEAARNRHLLRVVSDLHLLTRILRRRANLPSVPYLQRLERVCADHRAIAAALRQHDGAAARQCMQQHVEWARDYHLRALDWEERQQTAAGGRPVDVYFPLQVLEMLRKMETGDAAGQADSEGGAP
jgi:DNA-binding GntR family transcriptional regulator